MAYTDPIVLQDNAVADQTFVRQSSQKDGSDWIENDSTLATTRRIVFRHSNAGASVVKGSKPIRRHLVQFVHEAWNATLGKTEKATLNVTLTNDPGTTITTAQLYDLRAFARNFLTTTNIDKMLRDET